MAPITEVRSSITALVKSQPLVAVVVGGTSGIGKYTVHALARTHADQGKGLRTYIVGRNADAAKRVISECVEVCPSGHFEFVQAKDLSLLKDVDLVCAEITRIENAREDSSGPARVDILVMCQAQLSFVGRRETTEGLDKDMSLLYYSRMRFIVQLLPLLKASSLPAHVISVYAAGKESTPNLKDLSLRHPKNYSFINARSNVLHMKTLFMESLAERHRGQLSLVHVFPNMVITEGYTDPTLPFWFRWTYWITAPLLRMYAIPADESGDRTLFLATPRYSARPREDDTTASLPDTTLLKGSDGVAGSGAYAVNWDGEPLSIEKAYVELRKTGFVERVWDHTFKAFSDIETKGVFTE